MFGVYIYTFFLLRTIYSVLIGGEVETPDLPEDIIIYQILTWLPAHKAYELRCVCKSWCKKIESSPFAEAHNHRANPVVLITVFETLPRPPHFSTKLMQKIQYKNIMVRDFNPNDRLVYNSCNGLVLCAYFYIDVCYPVLANPVTKKLVNLPKTTTKNILWPLLGITYVASIRKYKVIHIFTCQGINKFGIEVLTIGENKWRLVFESYTTELVRYAMEEIKFIKDVAYWKIYELSTATKAGTTCVASFDMIGEKFRITNYPSSRVLFEISGSVGFASRVDGRLNQFDIWVLDDFDNGTWIKQQSILVEGTSRGVHAATTLANGRIIIFKSAHPYCYYAYDVQGKCTTFLNLRSIEELESYPRAHRDTLISCM